MARIEDYGADRRPADRSTRRARRLDRLGVLSRASTQAPASPPLLGDSDHGRWIVAPRVDAWEADAPLPPEHARARDRVGDGYRRGAGARTSCRRVGKRRTSCASSRACAGTCRHGLRARRSLRLRRHDPVGAAGRRRPHRGRGPGRALLPDAGRAPRREHARRSASSPLRKGERIPFDAHVVPVEQSDRRRAIDAEHALSGHDRLLGRTGRSDAAITASGRMRFRRSLAVLKALTYAPTGGIVAAPTTSLPEKDRRRAQLGLPLLLAARRDADAARLPERRLPRGGARLARLAAARSRGRSVCRCRSCTASPVSGGCPSSRSTWLPGYEGSQPVRVGNAAAEQFQLDVYGEVLDALAPGPRQRARDVQGGVVVAAPAARLPRARVEGARRGHLGGARAAAALHALEGDGLGRVRPRRQAVERFGLAGPVERWREIRAEIHREVLRAGLRRRAQLVHAVLRLEAAGREPAR